MNTSTIQTIPNEASSLIKFANNMRPFVASMTEDVRKAATEDRAFYPDRLHELGECLAEIDGAFAQIAETLRPYAGQLRLDFSLGQNVPSPDALFRSRGIVIQYHHQDKAWYAMRERRKAPGGESFLPALVLYDDGWDEWGAGGKGRRARMFEHEIEARTIAAATACPGETIPYDPRVPDRIAFIIVSDAPHEPGGEGVSIVAHFDQRPGMPFDLNNPEGAHRVAADALRFIGGATNTADQIERGLVAAGAASDGGAR